jgi:hypothetical protein
MFLKFILVRLLENLCMCTHEDKLDQIVKCCVSTLFLRVSSLQISCAETHVVTDLVPTCLQWKHLPVMLVDTAMMDEVVRLSRWGTFVNSRFVIPPLVKNCALFFLFVYLTFSTIYCCLHMIHLAVCHSRYTAKQLNPIVKRQPSAPYFGGFNCEIREGLVCRTCGCVGGDKECMHNFGIEIPCKEST